MMAASSELLVDGESIILESRKADGLTVNLLWTSRNLSRLFTNRRLSMTPVEGHLGGSVSWASDFSSGHDLMIHEFEPRVGLSAGSAEPAWDSLPPLSLCPSPACAFSLPK